MECGVEAAYRGDRCLPSSRSGPGVWEIRVLMHVTRCRLTLGLMKCIRAPVRVLRSTVVSETTVRCQRIEGFPDHELRVWLGEKEEKGVSGPRTLA